MKRLVWILLITFALCTVLSACKKDTERVDETIVNTESEVQPETETVEDETDSSYVPTEELMLESEGDTESNSETKPPVINPSISEPSVNEPSDTEPSDTEPPATEPPATEPPATEPPATDSPSVDQPPAAGENETPDW